MAPEQSEEEKDIKAIAESEEGKGDVSSPVEGSNQQSKNLGAQSQGQDDDDNDYETLSPSTEGVLPPEFLEALPPKEKEIVLRSMSITAAMQRSDTQGSPIAKQLKSEHITQIIENSEKESQREFEKSKISENTKRWGMGAILSLVVIVFVYAGVTKDKDLSEKVVLAGISAIGGFGAGYAVAKEK